MKTVIFDLDDTLLCGDSEFKWAEFTVEKGFIDKEFLCHCNSIAIVKDRRSFVKKSLIFPAQMVLNALREVEVLYYSF